MAHGLNVALLDVAHSCG